MAQKRKKRFQLVNYEKPGRGVTKADAAEYEKRRFSLRGFFPALTKKFSMLVMLNLIFFFSNFFLIAALLALSGRFDIQQFVSTGETQQIAFGLSRYGFSPVSASLWGVSGSLATMGYASTTTYILYAISALTLFTFGPSMAGLSYVIRNLVRGEYTDLKEYFGAIKKNFRQALLLGILDVLILVLFAGSLFSYLRLTSGGFGYLIMYYLALFIVLLYLMMRFYLYQLLVTFKLSVWKIIKNAYILTVAGIKRNIVGLIACGLVIALNVVLFIVFMPLGAILPFLLTPTLLTFISIYAAYPVMKKYMIDPYYSEDDLDTPHNDEEPVFHDEG